MCPLVLPGQPPALPAGWESGEAGLSSWSMQQGPREQGVLPALLGQGLAEGMAGVGVTPGVVGHKVGLEMLQGVERVEKEELAESGVATAARPLP